MRVKNELFRQKISTPDSLHYLFPATYGKFLLISNVRHIGFDADRKFAVGDTLKHAWLERQLKHNGINLGKHCSCKQHIISCV